MHPETREELRIRFKLTVLEYAKYLGVAKACGKFISRDQRFMGGNKHTSRKDELCWILSSSSVSLGYSVIVMVQSSEYWTANNSTY